MQELVGRLTALDPEASESLKVVAYFDTLVAAGAGYDALLRGAALLSGAVAGAEHRGRVSRRGSDGRDPGGEPSPRRPERPYASGTVWLERVGPYHANDEMIVERLALCFDLVEARRRPVSSLEIAVDAHRTLAERTTALANLHLDPETRIRLVATWPQSRASTPSSVILPTRYGIMRATLQRPDSTPPAPPATPDSGAQPDGHVGLGAWVRASHAPESWEGAVFALRMTDAAMPVIDATDMGALVLMARAYDPETPHEDVLTLAGLDERSAEILLAIVECDSLRAAATRLGVHHSTVQARHEALMQTLGYDPRTPAGKVRYSAAELLLRLSNLRHPAPSRAHPGH